MTKMGFVGHLLYVYRLTVAEQFTTGSLVHRKAAVRRLSRHGVPHRNASGRDLARRMGASGAAFAAFRPEFQQLRAVSGACVRAPAHISAASRSGLFGGLAHTFRPRECNIKINMLHSPHERLVAGLGRM